MTSENCKVQNERPYGWRLDLQFSLVTFHSSFSLCVRLATGLLSADLVEDYLETALMANPVENGEGPKGLWNAELTPVIRDRATEATREYAPDAVAEAEVELILSGLALLSSEVPVPARLGKYEIQGQIGRGGMGVVWKGFDPDLRRTVAIKVLSPHLAQSQVARRRFQREARAAAAISHENVLTIHSVEEQGETPFLVMEFVSGQSLKEYIARQGRLSVIEVIRLSAQIAQGLAAAHAQGVTHRDVKPANVMLHEGATRVRLMDFGLARVTFDNAELTSHDHAVGTPSYMAPEQICGRSVDARADLFSLGCVMYCMVAGHSPFQGRTHAETIHKILDLDPIPLHEVDPAFPHVLSEMVAKLLVKNPDDRYQSAFEVADVLRRLMTQLNQAPTDQIAQVLADKAPTIVVPSQPAAKPQPPAAKYGSVTALLVFLAVVTAGAFATWKYWPNGSSATPPAGGSSIAHGSNPISRPGDPAESPVAKLTEITVGSGPEATCVTLKDAIQRAAENCTITVVGPGPYAERLEVNRPELRGLKLIAKSRVQLNPSNQPTSSSPVLLIENVSNVTVEGFDFELSGESDHALTVTGAARDITVRDCHFTHTSSNATKSLVSISANATEPTSVIRLQHCQLSASGGAYCLSADSGKRMAPSLVCEDCLFSAPYTQLYASESCRRIRLAGNVFFHGENAINLSIKSWSPESRIEIVNNTFVGTRYWLGFIDSFRSQSVPLEQTDSQVCNNLILGGERVQAGMDQLDLVFAKWKFEANWWEPDTRTANTEDAGSRLVTYHSRLDVPVREDPRHDQFLVPATGSPLLTSGSGKDLPGYIGAKGPKETR